MGVKFRRCAGSVVAPEADGRLKSAAQGLRPDRFPSIATSSAFTGLLRRASTQVDARREASREADLPSMPRAAGSGAPNLTLE